MRVAAVLPTRNSEIYGRARPTGISVNFFKIRSLSSSVTRYRFWAFMDRTERHTNYPNLFRSTSLIHYLLVIFHWNGCLYHIIYKNNGFGSKNWVFSDSETADVVKQYLQSYYWCTLALTTIGDLPRYLFVRVRSRMHELIFYTDTLREFERDLRTDVRSIARSISRINVRANLARTPYMHIRSRALAMQNF